MTKEALAYKGHLAEETLSIPSKRVLTVVPTEPDRKNIYWKNSAERQEVLEEYKNPGLARDYWYGKFGGSVSALKDFPVWHKALDEIKNAVANGARLKSNIIAAAALHPHRLVVMELATNYPLPEALSEIVFSRDDLMDNDKLSIKFAQKRISPTGK